MRTCCLVFEAVLCRRQSVKVCLKTLRKRTISVKLVTRAAIRLVRQARQVFAEGITPHADAVLSGVTEPADVISSTIESKRGACDQGNKVSTSNKMTELHVSIPASRQPQMAQVLGRGLAREFKLLELVTEEEAHSSSLSSSTAVSTATLASLRHLCVQYSAEKQRMRTLR